MGRQAMARLWRVAHFVLTDYLELPPQRSSQHAHTPMLRAPTLGTTLRRYAHPSGAHEFCTRQNRYGCPI